MVCHVMCRHSTDIQLDTNLEIIALHVKYFTHVSVYCMKQMEVRLIYLAIMYILHT